MEILRLMVILPLIIFTTISGSKVTYKDDFAVITGKVTLVAAPAGESKQTAWTIDFPEGFNKDNCVCLAFGGRMYDNRGFCYGTGNEDAVGIVTGDIPKSIMLGYAPDTSKIWMQAYNIANSDHIYEYRIVLMKLDESEDYIAGDINGDGQVTIEDANLALKYYSGSENISLTHKQFKSGDIDKDGRISNIDALAIQKLIEQGE